LLVPHRFFEPEALSSCVRLQEVRLEDNLIRSISPPSSAGPAGLGACLPALRVLKLGSNRMIDAGECAQRLADIPCLEEVTLAGNPFVRKQPVSDKPVSWLLGALLFEARWHVAERHGLRYSSMG
jgi:hypothetical protein